MCHLDCIERLAERTNLVDLDENRVGGAKLDALFEVLHVRDEEIVADELALVADSLGESHPAIPVAFSHAVFDGIDRVLLDEFFEVLDLFVAGELLALCAFLPGVVVDAALLALACRLVELGGSAVHCDCDILAGLVAGLLDCGDDAIERVFDGIESGSETAFVADGRGEAAILENLLEVVEDFSAVAESFLEGGSADGANHELLERDRRVGVGTAIDDVHHRHGQGVCVRAADIPVKRHAESIRRSLGDCERDAENRVCAEFGLRCGAVQLEHELVDAALIAGALAEQRRGDDLVHVVHSLGNALAEVALGVAVAKLKCFVHASGSARRNSGAAKRAILENNIHFDCRIAARINDLTGLYFDDFHFLSLLLGMRKY